MEEIQRVKTIFLKGKNKRIGIELNHSSENGFFYLMKGDSAALLMSITPFSHSASPSPWRGI